jgi:hypothetical protein
VNYSRTSGQLPPHQRTSPPLSLHASPSPGVDGSRPGVLQELSPRPPASPSTGVVGWARRPVGTHQLPGNCTVSNPAPSWASIVRDGACANTSPAVSRLDFLALYERCIDSGLRTRIVIRHQDGSHEISISCRLSVPPVDAHAPAYVRRRRRRRKRAPVAAAASPSASQPAQGARTHSTPSPPASSPPKEPSPATIASPPAKRTRKAAKRRCEAELLRESHADDELLLSPISPARTAPFSPVPPDSTTSKESDSAPTFTPPSEPSSPMPVLLIMPASPPAGPPTPPSAPPTTPPPSRAPAGPPPPPPWPEAYVFSTDPDRIVYRKCCNRHYNFRWYSHCFMCNKP